MNAKLKGAVIAALSVLFSLSAFVYFTLGTGEDGEGPVFDQESAVEYSSDIGSESEGEKNTATVSRSAQSSAHDTQLSQGSIPSLRSKDAFVYRSYDEATLEALAAERDILAVKELANRIVRTRVSDEYLSNLSVREEAEFWEKRDQNLKRYTDLAIILGDTQVMEYAEKFYGEEAYSRDSEKMKEGLLAKFSFMEFSAMRGNTSYKYQSAPALLQGLEESRGSKIVLSDQDKVVIREKAKELYDYYEARRIKLGLPPFEYADEEAPIIPGYSLTEEYSLEMGENAF
ncbi:hypothetical protein QWI17_13030 [Gilvimarinus sp. SDUM040013]|uniref:Uncharacterized protein n=1 Tax=Gilvimarinus gilvus TaxID=3058038 RepID=A0ABU4RTU3_9GAMM|nr:hypothetical protein [Gilvimarinus sp. SDUM040013]MDO3386763.1 hypothetical protein [Gilvimarinus sp. SDUM040013]MDX6848307.1 hypothetical protein [Gilvimarinus sp. SDUM040013]